MPGAQLRHRMLDLQPRVQLDEVERAVRRRRGTRTCRRCDSRSSRTARSAAASISSRASGVSAGDGDSSISFWWRRWIEHSRSPSVSTPPVRVAEHLDLDVPRRLDHLLDVERGIAERRLRLGRGRAERVLELVRRLDEPHALAAAARRRLEQHRVSRARRPRRAPARSSRVPSVPGNERHAGRAHLVLRAAPCRPCAPSRRASAR